MKEIITKRIEQLDKELKALENKRITMNDVDLYREVYIEITLHKTQINLLNQMLEQENFQIIL
jgi:hypothetical protein